MQAKEEEQRQPESPVVAVGSRSSQAYGELFEMHADGTGLRQLTDDQWEEIPAGWLPVK